MSYPKVGNHIPHMPDEYHNRVDVSGMSLLISTPQCPTGVVIFVKDSIIVHLGKVNELPNLNGVPDFDAVIMNEDDLPSEAEIADIKTKSLQ